MALELPVMPAGVNGRHEALVRRPPRPAAPASRFSDDTH